MAVLENFTKRKINVVLIKVINNNYKKSKQLMVTKEITISDKFKFTFAWEYFSKISKVFYPFLLEERMMPAELMAKNSIKKKKRNTRQTEYNFNNYRSS